MYRIYDITLTNTHHNEESRHPPPEVDNRIPRAFHKVIRIGASSAYPVWQRRYHVCRNDEKRKVVVVESAGEDDEEKAYRKNLKIELAVILITAELNDTDEQEVDENALDLARRTALTYKRERDDSL